MTEPNRSGQSDHVAIIGMAGRFPGAPSVEAFWENLRSGVESITFFTDAELETAEAARGRLGDPRFVKAGAVLDDIELFDASFFGVNPRQAEIMDPQHRIFLECAWEAIERAGYAPERYRGAIGVFAGAGADSYFRSRLLPNRRIVAEAGNLQVMLGNDRNFLTTYVSYRLGLRGPSITVQTACSTSLVAVHLACQSLLGGECDMALAGGVSISVPQKTGYVYQEGGIPSPDGHCRAFDAQARGTVFGNGAAVVLLKRLDDAVADGDYVHAVIRGSAVDNDGSVKVGYTAPAVEGQSRVIAEALAMAGVDAATIMYVEAHGTGTPLGDPIEIAALTQAFRAHTEKRRYCAIGSVKTNIGHLDTAAGTAGLIKAVLALERGLIPPSLHYTDPNPEIDFENSPFFVVTEPREWPRGALPRRAGVSSFGLGGTNAHVVLEEAPPRAAAESVRSRHLIVLSAGSESALARRREQLADHLEARPELPVADVAYTLQVGRRHLPHRCALVCRDLPDAVGALRGGDQARLTVSRCEGEGRGVVFMLPGQGAQYVHMGETLYREEPRIREEIDRCCEDLTGELGFDLRGVLFPRDGEEGAQRRLTETAVTQPALFVVEYALARYLIGMGIRPAAMIGHSIGEYVAAVVAGVFSREEALHLVAVRGRLMQELPRGAMVAVSRDETEVAPLLDGELAVAAVNSPGACVVSGTLASVERFEGRLAAADIDFRRLRTSHAFHSAMMDPILEPFAGEVARIKLKSPRIPYVSNTTGTWITDAEATDPRYYANHLRRCVRFAEGVRVLLEDSGAVLLEVGPGRTLVTLARRQSGTGPPPLTLMTMRHPREPRHDVELLLGTLGRLWCEGVPIDWAQGYADERRLRQPLPIYPFERRRYWIEPERAEQAPRRAAPRGTGDGSGWFYVPAWKRSAAPEAPGAEGRTRDERRWLLFIDACGVGAKLAKRLERRGETVYTVLAGKSFGRIADRVFTVHPGRGEDFDRLRAELGNGAGLPDRIVHLWTVSDDERSRLDAAALERGAELGFYSLLSIAQNFGTADAPDTLRLVVVTNGAFAVAGERTIRPEKSLIEGPCLVVPLEFPRISCRIVDVPLPPPGSWHEERLIGDLLSEVGEGPDEYVVAYRGGDRWIRAFERCTLEEAGGRPALLRDGGVYLVTGGLGGMGLEIAGYIARTARSTLVLVDRADAPPRDAWDGLLASRGAGDRVRGVVEKLRAMERRGATVSVVRADVTDAGEMARVAAEVRGRYGRIRGIVHAAGVPGGGMILLKRREAAARILAPKVSGTLVLDEVLGREPLDFFVICSSLNAVYGVIGQIDYCAANAFEDAFARYRSMRDGTFTVSINWDRWNEVGMAVDAATPPWLREIRRGAEPGLPVGPLIDSLIEESPDREVYVTVADPERHWVLDEHRIGGNAVAPGTAYLEIAREAFARHAGEDAVEIRNVRFVKPLVVGDGSPREVVTILTRGSAGFDFLVASRERDGGGGAAAFEEHAAGEIGRVGPVAERVHRIAEIERRCTLREHRFARSGGHRDSDVRNPLDSVEDGRRDSAAPAGFGPRWHVVQWVKIGDGEALAYLELPEAYEDDLVGYTLHPSLLDMATGYASWFAGGEGYIPFWYGTVTVRHPLKKKLYSHATFDRSEGEGRETMRFDLVVTDERGVELAMIKEFTMKRIADYGVFADPRSVMGEAKLAGDPAAAAGDASRGAGDGRGLTNAQGVDVFARVLQGAVFPQVLVSTVDLNESIERSKRFTRERIEDGLEKLRGSRPLHPRTGVTSEYAAPRTAIERTIATIWGELLGIEGIGIRDNFFELGGDSVIGLRIVVRAKKEGLDLEPPMLFEHQTIEELARALEERRGPAATAAPGEASAPMDAGARVDAHGRDGAETGGDVRRSSDFPDADLSEEDLSTILSTIERQKRGGGR